MGEGFIKSSYDDSHIQTSRQPSIHVSLCMVAHILQLVSNTANIDSASNMLPVVYEGHK